MELSTAEGTYAQQGFPFPLPILLVRTELYNTDFESLLEGTMVKVVNAFDTLSVYGGRFETVIISRTSDEQLPELVDWINLHVMPRVRVSRRPVWL